MLKAAATRCGQFRDCGRRPLTNSVAGRWAITSAGGGCRSCAGARQPCTGTKRAAMGALTGPVEVMVCASGGRERRGKCAIRPISGPKGGPLEGSAWQLGPRVSLSTLHRLAPRANQRLQCAAMPGCVDRFNVLPLGVGDDGPGVGRGPRASLIKRET